MNPTAACLLNFWPVILGMLLVVADALYLSVKCEKRRRVIKAQDEKIRDLQTYIRNFGPYQGFSDRALRSGLERYDETRNEPTRPEGCNNDH